MEHGETVEVRLHGEPCGVLTAGRKPGSGSFSYLPHASRPLSLSLPVHEGRFDTLRARNWFIGLLPEGDRLDALAAHAGLQSVDWIGLLAAYGSDCAGAVTFGPLPAAHADLEPVIRTLPAVHAGATTESLAGLVAGYQPKAVGTPGVLDGSWTTPGADEASSYILKPEQPRWPGMAHAEAWAMTLARHAAEAAETSMTELGGRPVLLSTRYDRLHGTGKTAHQEDLLQALGLPHTNKYATPGGGDRNEPTLRKAAALLTAHAADPAAELDELLRHLTVNLLMGNLDWHAKNVSFLHLPGGRIRLAPLYDTVPVRAFLPKEHRLSLPVNGKFRIDRVRHDDVIAEAVSWGMDPDAAELVVRVVIDAVRDALPAADAAVPGRPAAAAQTVQEQLAALDSIHDPLLGDAA